MLNTNDLNAARRKKALDRLFNFDGRVCSLRDYLADNPPVSRSVTTRNHETRKRDCEYKEIKPVTEYTVWFNSGTGIDVPKLVWDMYPTLPTKENNYTF